MPGWEQRGLTPRRRAPCPRTHPVRDHPCAPLAPTPYGIAFPSFGGFFQPRSWERGELDSRKPEELGSSLRCHNPFLGSSLGWDPARFSSAEIRSRAGKKKDISFFFFLL